MDLQALKIFTSILDQGSFSEAARSLGLTQPAISQQIAKLESRLSGKLFERVGHRIIPTDLGLQFQQVALGILEKFESFEDEIRQKKSVPEGLVRYAMPESCQWTPHYRKIMSQITEFPGIHFEIGIMPSQAIIQQVLEGKIDFGFVAGERSSPDLRFEKFSDEPYAAVCADRDLFKPWQSEDEESIRLVTFPGWELFFDAWNKTNRKTLKSSKSPFKPAVQIGTLAGAIHAIQEGAGVGILPLQCIGNELKSKKLHLLPGQKPASHPVHIIRKVGTQLPKRAEVVLELLKTAKKELG